MGAQCPGESGETDGSLMLNDFLPEVEEIEEEVMEKLKLKVKVERPVLNNLFLGI